MSFIEIDTGMKKNMLPKKSKSEIVTNEKVQKYVSVTQQMSKDENFGQEKEGWFRFSISSQNGGGPACQDGGDCECQLEPF